MTAILAPAIVFVDRDSNGAPLAFGTVGTYQAGTLVPQATYVDSTQTTPNTNPITLNNRGEANIWLNPLLNYKFIVLDSAGRQIRVVDQIQGSLTYTQLIAILTQSFIGSILYPRTAAEIAAGVTPTNYQYPAGVIDRYGTNTTAGTTDMSTALQSSVSQSLQPSGAPVRVGNNAYSIVTPPTFGGATTAMLPIDIGGNGLLSQLIHNGTASAAPLFNFSGKNGWYLHDLLICGNTAHKNDGIYAGVAGGAEQIRWRIERVTAMMAGVGLKIADTNTGVVEQFRSWPNNPPTLIVAQSVTVTDISHHIYLTGSFANLLTIKDCDCLPSAAYAAGQRGIKADASALYNVNIIGGDYESNGGANTETGIDISTAGACVGLTLLNVYHEGTAISLKNVSTSLIGPTSNGNVGGSLVMVTGCTSNLISGIRVVTYNNQDPSNYGNTFVGLIATTTWTDSADAANFSNQPNRYIGCSAAAQPIADRGGIWRKLLTYSANMTPDTYDGNHRVIRVTNGTDFTINAPTHVYNGQELQITVRNESGGAMGVITWTGIGVAGWVKPANGFNRTIAIYYDTDFAAWRQKWVGANDVAN